MTEDADSFLISKSVCLTTEKQAGQSTHFPGAFGYHTKAGIS